MHRAASTREVNLALGVYASTCHDSRSNGERNDVRFANDVIFGHYTRMTKERSEGPPLAAVSRPRISSGAVDTELEDAL